MAEANINDKFNFELVSPERKLMSRPVEKVVIPGEEGDFGVLANHASLVATIRPGVVKVYDERDGEATDIFIAGGFADVSAENCTILAEEAVPVVDLDSDNLQKRLGKVETKLEQTEDKGEKQLLSKELGVIRAKLAALSIDKALAA